MKKTIEEIFERPVALPHQAAALAYELFLLLKDLEPTAELSRSTRQNFRHKVRQWGMGDLHCHQAKYAIRIASDAAPLEYEEMYKLFGLCNEIHALEFLGMQLSPQEREALESSVRGRFQQNPELAKIAATQMAEDWNRDFWWYREFLKD